MSLCAFIFFRLMTQDNGLSTVLDDPDENNPTNSSIGQPAESLHHSLSNGSSIQRFQLGQVQNFRQEHFSHQQRRIV